MPHWRFYYPYHYAPMIVDLGTNIVASLLDSKTVIEQFEVDFNCPANPEPYTPFQQLLCIMPMPSINLLPPCYETIARGDLIDFFPDDFPVDLNGKAMFFEALVLIPYADDALFMQKEAELLAANQLSAEDVARNTTAFEVSVYRYDPAVDPQPLPSTLTNFRRLDQDFSTLEKEPCESIGRQAFESRILPGIVMPSPGYPTFTAMGVTELLPDSVRFRDQRYRTFLAIIPQCIEETKPEELERLIQQLVAQERQDVFVGFPY